MKGSGSFAKNDGEAAIYLATLEISFKISYSLLMSISFGLVCKDVSYFFRRFRDSDSLLFEDKEAYTAGFVY
jgi:hypothetical protein